MRKLFFGLTLAASLFASAAMSHAFRSYGNEVDTYCAPAKPFAGDCNLCHGSSAGMDAFLSDNLDYFCPAPPPPACPDGDLDGYTDAACGGTDCNDGDSAINPAAAENCTDAIDNNCNGLVDAMDASAVGCPPVCTDQDGDGYAVEGGSCGPVDCDDASSTVSPAAAEECTDTIDNNCNGLVDSADPGAVGCPSVCTDSDGDGYALEGGSCGAADCDDTDSAVNPGAIETCIDGLDNNCNGLIDTADPNATGCPAVCTDSDGDGFAVDGGACGMADCDDNDPAAFPGAVEVCEDGLDNDCDTLIDEGCAPICPDADEDGYLDATCGGADCNDTDPLINPAAAEICGNVIDENCNGMSDDECLACPEGGVLTIREAEYEADKRRLEVEGRSHINTTITLLNADSGAVLAEGIKVRGGKWKVKIKDIAPRLVPTAVAAVNSDGCSAERVIEIEEKEDHDRDDDHDRDRDRDRDRDGDRDDRRRDRDSRD